MSGLNLESEVSSSTGESFHSTSSSATKSAISFITKQLAARFDTPPQLLEFNGLHGYCHACSIRLPSQGNAEVHLACREHRDRVENYRSGSLHQDGNQTQNTTIGRNQGQDRTASGDRDRSKHQQESLDFGSGSYFTCDSSTAFTNQLIGSLSVKSSPGEAEDLPSYTFNGLRGYCNVCKIDLTSRQHMTQHIEGAKHKNQEERLRMSQPGSSGIAPLQTRESINSLAVGVREEHGREMQPYTLNGSRGRCHVCQIDLTSMQHAQSHLAGSKHVKREQQWRAGSSDQLQDRDSWCAVCQVPFTGPESAAQHYSSEKHLKRMAALSGVQSSFPSTQVMASGVSQSHLNKAFIPRATAPSIEQSGNQYPRSELVSSGRKDKQEENREEEYVFDGCRGKCNVCKIELTSEQHARQHLSGSKHQKEKSRWKAGSEAQLPLFCEICRVPFSGPESAQQHYSSAKHLKKAGMANTQTLGSPRITSIRPTPGETIANYDFERSPLAPPIPRYEMPREVQSLAYPDSGLDSLQRGTSYGSTQLKLQFESPASTPSRHEPDGSSLAYPRSVASSYPDSTQLKGRYEESPSAAPLPTWQVASLRYPAPSQGNLIPQPQRSPPSGESQTPQRPVISPLQRMPPSETSLSFELPTNIVVDASAQQVSSGVAPSALNRAGIPKSVPPSAQPDINRHVSVDSPPGGSTVQEDRGEAYTFNGLQGHCNVCQIDLTSPQHAKQHLDGIKHAKAERRWRSTSSESYPLFCDICLVPFSGPESAEQHFTSKKHAKKSRSALDSPPQTHQIRSETVQPGQHCDYQGAAIPIDAVIKREDPMKDDDTFLKTRVKQERHDQGDSLSVSEGQGHPGYVQVSKGQPLTPDINIEVHEARLKCEFDQRYAPQQSPAPAEGQRVQGHMVSPGVGGVKQEVSDDPDEQTHVFELGRGKCFVCNIDLTSQQHAGQHLAGQKHAKKVRQLKSDPTNFPLWCDVCRVPFSGQESAAQHFVSAKHHKKAGSIGTTGSPSTHQGATPVEIQGTALGEAVAMTGEVGSPFSSGVASSNINQGFIEKAMHQRKMNNLNIGMAEEFSCESNMSPVFSTCEEVPPTIDPEKLSDPLVDDLTAAMGSISLNQTFRSCGATNCEFHCRVCNLHLTGNLESHVQGKNHKLLALKEEKAPHRPLPPMTKFASEVDLQKGLQLTESRPRGYQFELYAKAMKHDAVIFLPTGTGKTLVAAMIIKHMLLLNPARQVLFLVDRVLLVLQQSQNLRKQLGAALYPRYDVDRGSNINRQFRVAGLCSGQQEMEGDIPLWQQDVLVATSDYYQNLLQQGIIRWEDLSLVIMDEAHHCMKNHSFNTLLQKYHHKIPFEQRPRVVGLTASPAGQGTVQDTVILLRHLLANIGNAHLAVVRSCTEELDQFKSNTVLKIKEVSFSPEEEVIHRTLQDVIYECILKMAPSQNVLPKEVLATKLLVFEHIDFIMERLREMDFNSYAAEGLMRAVDLLYDGLLGLGMGLPYAYKALKELTDTSCGSFTHLKDIGIQCTDLETLTKKYLGLQAETADLDSPAVKQLILELTTGVEWDRRREGANPIALVLVQQRGWARVLKELLEQSSVIQQYGLACCVLTGHGSGGSQSAAGMSVKEQGAVLQDIRANKYQVLVATSVAEEGLDLPECELVVQMDPPRSVTALVQIRGRARKRGSRFVALCRSSEQRKTYEDLLFREENMYAAASKILEEQPELMEF